MNRLQLPSVTLCAVTSVNLPATLSALERCLDQVAFGRCLLITDAPVTPGHPEVEVAHAPRIGSGAAYSHFMLKQLNSHIRTSHCLVVQWDGFILDSACWDPAFLDYDYIGAVWPQFSDGASVGNGGFSLRSKRLLEACCDPGFTPSHPEDVAICRANRALLEARHAIRFASPAMAARFAFERSRESARTFGFHGVFNMTDAIGADDFWSAYQTLDDPSTAFHDYWRLLAGLATGRDRLRRCAGFTADYIRHRLRNRSARLQPRA